MFMNPNLVFDAIHGHQFSVIGIKWITVYIVTFIIRGGVRHSYAEFICTRETTHALNLGLLLLCNFISLTPASLFTVHSLQPYQSCIKFVLM